MADTTTAVETTADETTAEETAVDETVDETTVAETADDEASGAGEEEDTLGAEISLMLGDGDNKSTTSGKSFKSLRSSIAGSLRKFSMGSKVSGLNWKSSQFSMNSATTNDYMDPVQRRNRKAIGKTLVREDHHELIKEECIVEIMEMKELIANLLFFDENHPEFAEQPLQNVMDIMSRDMELMSAYIDDINWRIERLGRSPDPSTVFTPPKPPPPNFIEQLFCYHKYVPSDSEEEMEEEEEGSREGQVVEFQEEVEEEGGEGEEEEEQKSEVWSELEDQSVEN